MKEFKNLKRVAVEELEKLDAAYSSKSEFTEKDAEMYRCLMSGLKNQLTAEAMMGASQHEYMPEEDMDGMSGRRGRAANGRYISMEGGNSYTDGYTQGYSEGMRQSGHYYPIDYRMRY